MLVCNFLKELNITPSKINFLLPHAPKLYPAPLLKSHGYGNYPRLYIPEGCLYKHFVLVLAVNDFCGAIGSPRLCRS